MDCKEYWRPIANFEGYYEISNKCSVRSVDRTVKSKNGVLKRLKGREIRPYKTGQSALGGYYYAVILCKNGKEYHFLIHQLGAISFGLPNPNGFTCINHKDENPENNFVFVNPDGSVDPEKSNLEWCDHSYNNSYGTRIERWKSKMSKPINQYSLDGKLIKQWKSDSDLRKERYFSIGKYCKIKDRKPHYGFIWEYAY